MRAWTRGAGRHVPLGYLRPPRRFMEAPHSCLTTGEQSGGQDRCPSESRPRGQSESPPPPSSKPHGPLQQPRHPRRQHPERKRLRHQRQSVESGALGERQDEAPDATATSGLPPEAPPPPTQEGTPKQKRERKPQRPGKYVCTYCGRACAKPSVLQKHIRSHTGERPYPCGPCGFSFKTKSNLYKHRKSHTHRVKAGLAVGEPPSVDEQATESEDETQQPSDAEKQRGASLKSQEIERSKSWSGGNDDSYAVKKRLALRLSRGKHGPQDSPDEKASALTFGSRGSTESGYFSRSESTEQPQDSPPNTSAKSYAEIILGKYGRLGHLQRTSRQHNQQPPGQEDKGVPFTVPKKQVIDHITKLITINEAVVDTSKIDRVKPRRFSLSRKSSSESLKSPTSKGLLIQAPKVADLGFKSSGSITMGVPCEKFHHSSLSAEKPSDRTPSPLVRSHSMPSPQSPLDSSCGSAKFRSSQSFDRRPPSDRPTPRRYGMLKRQPAIEIPLGAELPKEESEGSPLLHPDCRTAVPDPEERRRHPYECEACGSGCRDWEGLQRHRQNLCPGPRPQNEAAAAQTKPSQLLNQSVRAGASALRKRRKEESFESDDPASPGVFPGQPADENNVYGGPRRQTPQTCSVIQHTSSFEKQESLSGENQATGSPPHEENLQTHPHQESSKGAQRLVRQHSVQVPEIFVTEDGSLGAGPSTDAPSAVARQPEKTEEFQWPQRSPSLSQLPIEKLPPKKKRLRLAEVAQSSGESSFDSASLPRSPSQDSSASYASSRSTSFEESNRPDADATAPPSARKSRAPNMLTVPGVHQHKEMRRSASEQAPHDPQPGAALGETRSKSFDYSCLSPERSAVGWRERRKCLLIRHTAVRDPDEEEEDPCPNHRSPESPRLPSHTSSSPGEAPPEIQPQWELHPPGGPNSVVRNSNPTEEPVSHPNKGQAPPPVGSSGAARAHYLPVSTGLKLEIPPAPGVPSSTPLITAGQELLRPAVPPAVAVRLQADTLAPPRAIYTTLSQAAAPRCPGNVEGCVPKSDPEPWPPDYQRAPGSGGSKRMLSPSNSIEIHPESQQQQKRVKEEEGGRGVGEVLDREVKGEVAHPSLLGAASPFPSLLPSTCNSWCYLNYTKPNPSALNKHEPSVYSSWSTTGYDPNPPGLSSKTALSLLSCRQRPGASVYTTAPMSASAAEPEQGGDGAPPRQVYTSQSYGNQDATREGLGGLGILGERSRLEKEGDISQSRSNPTPLAEPRPTVAESPGPKSEGRDHLKESGEEVSRAGTHPGLSEDADNPSEQKVDDGGGGGNMPERSLAEPEPNGSAPRPVGDATPKSSASARRALFARRRLDATSSPGVSPAQSGAPGRAPTPPRSPSPGPLPPQALAASTSGKVSPPPGLSPADAPSLGHACLHRLRDDEVGPAYTVPSRTRGPDNLLRHLPPHSQRPGRAPSLLIPIGGIHMIQPRSLLPLYTLVSSPSVNPPGTSWRFSDAPKRRPPLLPQRPAPPGASPDHADPSPGE